MFGRLIPLIVKELQLAFREPDSRRLLIIPVIIQLAIFPFAATLEVRSASIAVLNQDQGAVSNEIVQRLTATKAFPKQIQVMDERQLRAAIDDQKALLGLWIPENFSRSLAAGKPAEVLAILDGRRSNSSQIAFGYAQTIVRDYGAEIGKAAGRVPSSEVVVRNWFNPNLDYQWFILPSLVAIITTIGSLIVTAMSVAREREQGTFDQLLVTPLTPGMIMVGKTIPALLVAMGQATIVVLAAIFVFGIPFRGSLTLLYVSMFFYALALAGFGLFISSLCSTQQQAFLGVFTFMVPAVMLSGYVSPVENMPRVLQWLSWVNPLRHFIVIVKGLFLKAFDASMVWTNLWPLLLISIGTMSLGYWMFRRRTA